MRRQEWARSASVTGACRHLLVGRGSGTDGAAGGSWNPGGARVTRTCRPARRRPDGGRNDGAFLPAGRVRGCRPRVHAGVRCAGRYPRRRDEADLSAQEAQARPHPRLPCPHEHPRRAPRAQAAPGQGPQAPDGVAPAVAAKRRRLSRSAEFERVYRQGRSKGNRFLVLYAFPRSEEDAASRPADEDGPRLGLSVSRKVGGAVDRARVKRCLREAFWTEAERLPAGSDYVVVARPDAKGLTEREGTGGMRRSLAELVDGIRGSRPSQGDDS